MDAVRDLFDSLKAYLRDRFANPLYAGFVIAWAALNFRLLLVLFGDGSWKEKISYIDYSLYTANWHWFWYGFLYPLLVASGYVIASPFIYRWVTVFLKKVEKQTLTQLLEVAGETPLPKEAADKLRRALLDERRKRTAEQKEANATQDEQAAQIGVLSDELAAFKTTGSGSIGKLIPTDQISEKLQAEQRSNDDEQPQENYTFALKTTDFAGQPSAHVKQLVERGLSQRHLDALYGIRNYVDFDVQYLRNGLGLTDIYSAQVIVDRLQGLHLIEQTDNKTGEFAITPLGRQALEAASTRGFKP